MTLHNESVEEDIHYVQLSLGNILCWDFPSWLNFAIIIPGITQITIPYLVFIVFSIKYHSKLLVFSKTADLPKKLITMTLSFNLLVLHSTFIFSKLFLHRCKECTRVFFCSDTCRISAWSTYHQWECKGLEVCHSIGIAHLGLRVALLADSSDKYKQVFDLLTHMDDMEAEDLYQYTVVSFYISESCYSIF